MGAFCVLIDVMIIEPIIRFIIGFTIGPIIKFIIGFAIGFTIV